MPIVGDTFEAKLAFGAIGEDMVSRLLMERDWYCLPCADIEGSDNAKGPRLLGQTRGYVLPDLLVFRNGEQRFVEVKYKSRATLTRMNGRWEHGVAKRLIDEYLEVQRITGIPVFLVIVEKSTGAVLSAKLDELNKTRREYNGNQQDRGGMYFFDRAKFSLLTNVNTQEEAS